MNPYSPITDVDWITEIEELYPGWSIYEVDVYFGDGGVAHGTIQGDGAYQFAPETFVADEDDL